MTDIDWRQCKNVTNKETTFDQSIFGSLPQAQEYIQNFEKLQPNQIESYFYETEQNAEFVGILAIYKDSNIQKILHISSIYNIQLMSGTLQQKTDVVKLLHLLTKDKSFETQQNKQKKAFCECSIPSLINQKTISQKQFIHVATRFLSYYKDFLHHHKVGVVYQQNSQETEEVLLSKQQESESTEFQFFYNQLGEVINMQKHEKYCGDTGKLNGNGVYDEFKDHKIFYHLCTQMPFNQKDEQQLDRKRHIGNDNVVLVFRECTDKFQPLDYIVSKMIKTYILISTNLKENETNDDMDLKCNLSVYSRLNQQSQLNIFTDYIEIDNAQHIDQLKYLIINACSNCYVYDQQLKRKVEQKQKLLIIEELGKVKQ